MILMSVFIYSYFKTSIVVNMDRALYEEYHFISNQFNKDSFLNPIILQNPQDIVYIYEGDSIRYYTRNRYFDQNVPKNNSKRTGFYYEIYNGYNFRTAKIKKGNYTVSIMRNIDSEKESLSHMLVLLILTGFLSLLLAYIIAKYISKKALKPIEISWNNQVNFVQDASHELRTPVSIIQSKLESLLRNPNSTIEDEAETVAVAMRETRQIKKMISELLSLTKEESIVKINNENVDIEALFSDIFESYIEIAEYQNKKFSYKTKMKNKFVNIDKSKLEHLIRILVDNAFKYTKENESIDIEAVEKGRNRVQISVSDTGIGISQSDQKHIFERFFRSDTARASSIEGSGIGLSIAKMIAGTINGNIRVVSKLGKGTKFIIDIPRGKIVKNIR